MKRWIKGITIFLLLAVAAFGGCGRGKQDPDLEEAGSQIGNAYKKSAEDLGITDTFSPEYDCFAISGNAWYFGARIPAAEGAWFDHGTELYSISRTDPGDPRLIASFQSERLLSFSVVEKAGSEDRISIISGDNERGITIWEYTPDGTCIDKISVKDEAFQDAFVYKHIKLTDGRYVAINAKQMFVITGDGSCSEGIPCPGAAYQGLIQTGDGSVYVTYWESAHPAEQQTKLAEVDLEYNRLQDTIQMPGDGSFLFAREDGRIVSLNTRKIFAIDPKSAEEEILVDLTKVASFAYDRIKAFHEEEGGFAFLSWDSRKSARPVESVFLSLKSEEEINREVTATEEEPGNYDELGRRIITIYAPSEAYFSLLIGTDLINDFNADNEKYCVQLDSHTKDINVLFAEKESPDLVLTISSTDIEKYYQQGFLADLLPLMETTGAIDKEDVQQYVYQCFGFHGGLYAIPRYCNVQTLFITRSQVGDRSGWNVEEYLDFLEEHPAIQSALGCSQVSTLRTVLTGNMDAYVNWDTGDCYFTEDNFKRVVERIRNMDFSKMQCPEVSSPYGSLEQVDRESGYILNAWLPSLYEVANQEAIYQDELVYMGLPSDDGETDAVLSPMTNLCIPSKSRCKEGAMEFLAYMLHYPRYSFPDPEAEEPNLINMMRTHGNFWSLKSIYEEDLHYAIGTHVINWHLSETDEYGVFTLEVTGEQKEKAQQALDYGKPDTYVRAELRRIIQEELEPYFQGDKTLDSVCSIIQGRAKILINENRE